MDSLVLLSSYLCVTDRGGFLWGVLGFCSERSLRYLCRRGLGLLFGLRGCLLVRFDVRCLLLLRSDLVDDRLCRFTFQSSPFCR